MFLLSYYFENAELRLQWGGGGKRWSSGLGAGLSSCDLQVRLPLMRPSLPPGLQWMRDIQCTLNVHSMTMYEHTYIWLWLALQYYGLWADIGQGADSPGNANNFYFYSFLYSRVSQISTFVFKKLTGSGLMDFSEALRIQWYIFSRVKLLYAMRISTQFLKFLWEPKIKFSILFHFVI